jgi:hypothetical protein
MDRKEGTIYHDGKTIPVITDQHGDFEAVHYLQIERITVYKPKDGMTYATIKWASLGEQDLEYADLFLAALELAIEDAHLFNIALSLKRVGL